MITALMAPPGAGKTTMIALTAEPPVHFVDIDRKLRSMANIQGAIKSGRVTYKEIGDTIAEDGLGRRLDALVKNEKPTKPPRGWTNLANYLSGLESDAQAKAARTLAIDSYTQGAMHMKAHIQYLLGKPKFQWDAWSTWKSMWQETTTVLIDYCLANDKNLVVTLHERVSEKPGDQTERVRVQVAGEGGGKTREYQGTMDVLIAGSIEGAFGLEFGTFFTDVYALRVDVEKGVPTWRCRVHPDGKRDLRCSFNVREHEYEPDFRLITGGK